MEHVSTNLLHKSIVMGISAYRFYVLSRVVHESPIGRRLFVHILRMAGGLARRDCVVTYSPLLPGGLVRTFVKVPSRVAKILDCPQSLLSAPENPPGNCLRQPTTPRNAWAHTISFFALLPSFFFSRPSNLLYYFVL